MTEEISDFPFAIYPLYAESRSKMSIIGNIGEFDSNLETWDSYIERFELFLSCNGIDDQNKKVSTLLTVVGVKTFSLVRDLCTPEKPTSKSYDALVKLIRDHLYPKPNVIAERYKFSLRNQLEHESISDYVANLKKLSTHCNFGTNLNDYLRDRMVSGIHNENTKQKLLAETDLTFDKAVKLMTSLEAAEKNAASLKGDYYRQQGGRVQRLAAQQRYATPTRQDGSTSTRGAPGRGQATRNQHQPNTSGSAQVKCYCCGQSGHMSRSCRFHGCVCHHCGAEGLNITMLILLFICASSFLVADVDCVEEKKFAAAGIAAAGGARPHPQSVGGGNKDPSIVPCSTDHLKDLVNPKKWLKDGQPTWGFGEKSGNIIFSRRMFHRGPEDDLGKHHVAILCVIYTTTAKITGASVCNNDSDQPVEVTQQRDKTDTSVTFVMNSTKQNGVVDMTVTFWGENTEQPKIECSGFDQGEPDCNFNDHTVPQGTSLTC